MKKLFLGFLFTCIAVSLFACTITNDPEPDPEQPVVLTNFVRDLAEGAKTRTYNELFDEMVEDFSTESSANVKNHLRVVVSNTIEAAPNSDDASIYKMATGAYELQNYDGIGFKIRTVGKGTLSLDNLVLALRGDDAWDTYQIKLSDAVNPDGEALPKLTSEYQEFVICPNLSIEDDTTEYQLKGAAGESGTKVLDKILGFHLYLTGECSQIIEIEEVYIVKGADKTTLDNFDREKVNKADTTCWWRDSTGFIVQQGYGLDDGATYNINLGDTTGGNLVLNIMGDTTGTTVGGVKWENLKDDENNPIVAAVNGAFYPIVINLANSGITARSFDVKSTTEVVISEIFTTDLNDKAPVTEYPTLDVSTNVAMFDNFNRTQSGFDGDYDKSSTNPIVTGAGLNYALSYHNGDKVTVADGYVTFDATTEVDYINFKEGHTVYDHQKYLVLVVKATDGATFDNFRFDIGSGVTYINQMYSAFGLALPKADATNYPYTDANGFMWLIIDLAESGMTPNANDGYIDFYYSGTGKLMIDAAFYCNAEGENVEYKEYATGAITTVADLSAAEYFYMGGFSADGDKLVKLDFTGSTGATLASLRIQGDGMDAIWFKDGGIYNQYGEVISSDTSLEGLVIIIDLEKSGLNVAGWNHVHGGAAGLTGSIQCKAYRMHDTSKDVYQEIATGDITSVADLSTAEYFYMNGFSGDGDKLVKLDFTGSTGATLASLRIQGDGMDVKWFKDGQIYDQDGNVIDGNTSLEGLVIIIDLEKSGLNVAGWNHVHGGAAGLTGSIQCKAYRMHDTTTDKYEVIETGAINSVADLSTAEYFYMNGFSGDGDKLVKLDFTGSTGATLASLRIQGEGMDVKWFKDGQIYDQDGNVIDGNTSLEGLVIIIDLEKSGLNVAGWNHVHGGAAGLTGSIQCKAYRMHDKASDKYKEIETGAITSVADLSTSEYFYMNGFSGDGDKLVKLDFTGSTGATLASLRIQGEGMDAMWFKDAKIYDENGNVIDGNTSLEGLVIVIDLEKSGLNVAGWNHVHGGAAGLTGSIQCKAYRMHDVTYEKVMAALVQDEPI